MSTRKIISRIENLAEVDQDDLEVVRRDDEDVLRKTARNMEDEFSGKNAAAVIQQIIERENVNHKELAERMGCSRQNVSQLLSRRNANMRYDSFYRMAKTLGYEIVLRKI